MRELSFPPGTRFCCYLRDSGGVDQELSTEQQLAEINALCRRQEFILTKTFEDKARTGRHTVGRDDFFDMRRYLLKEKGSGEAGILLWSFARFSRNFKQFSFYCAEFELAGYKLISIVDDVPDTPEGELMRNIIAYSYDRQVNVLGQEVRRALHNKAAAGAFPAGVIPVGYKPYYEEIGQKRDGSPRFMRRLAIDPQTAPVVRKAWQMRAAGHTIPEIHAACGLHKSETGYRIMFHNEIYIGLLIYGKGEVTTPNACDPLIDIETWQKVQAINQANQDKHARAGNIHPRRATSSFLLSGLLRCNICGRLMKGRPHKSRNSPNYLYRAYHCVTHTHYFDACHARMIGADHLEKAILERLRETLTDEALLSKLRLEIARQEAERTDDTGRDLADARQELDETNRALENLYRFVETGGWESDEEIRSLRKRIGDKERRRRELNEAIARLEAARPPARPALPDQIDGAAMWEAIAWAKDHDRRELQLLLRSMLSEIRAEVGPPPERKITGTITIQELPGLPRAGLSVSI